MFFRVQVFQGPGPGSGSRVQSPGPGSRVRVQGLGSGSRVRLEVLEVAAIDTISTNLIKISSEFSLFLNNLHVLH